jgi:hypothetical protein
MSLTDKERIDQRSRKKDTGSKHIEIRKKLIAKNGYYKVNGSRNQRHKFVFFGIYKPRDEPYT